APPRRVFYTRASLSAPKNPRGTVRAIQCEQSDRRTHDNEGASAQATTAAPWSLVTPTPREVPCSAVAPPVMTPYFSTDSRGSALSTEFNTMRPYYESIAGILLLLLHAHTARAAPPRSPLEQTVCGAESIAITKVKALIVHPDATIAWATNRSRGPLADEFNGQDGRKIEGLVWRAKNPVGYLLVAQGTSTMAAEIYETFERFRALGLDVYIYDYRGFGRSTDGNSSFNAIISDYSRRIDQLN